MSNYAKHLAKALYHLDMAGASSNGTAYVRPLWPLRLRLSRLFSESGFEYSERAPGIRKRREPANDALTDAELDAAGKRLAEALKLKRDPEHKDRWCTEWGTYTNQGLARRILEAADRIQMRDTRL